MNDGLVTVRIAGDVTGEITLGHDYAARPWDCVAHLIPDPYPVGIDWEPGLVANSRGEMVEIDKWNCTSGTWSTDIGMGEPILPVLSGTWERIDERPG